MKTNHLKYEHEQERMQILAQIYQLQERLKEVNVIIATLDHLEKQKEEENESV